MTDLAFNRSAAADAVQRFQSAPASPWIIQCDFDGTISHVDVTDSLLTRFGQPGWQALEDAWERGDIGSRECMQEQVALLDMSADELHAHLDSITIDPAFPAFVEEAHALGISVQVVSDGIDYAIRRILRRHGLGDLPIISNHLEQIGPRQWRLDFPHASTSCTRNSGTCKCEQLTRQYASVQRVLFIGDSTSDFCVSGKADFVLAKYKLIDHCRAHGYPFSAFTTFREARELMLGLVAQAEAYV
jgi:2,3-diketo-5-methylthio-1-phosphopentane phosphatase